MRPKGLPPDTQPRQRVLDWLIKYAPSASSPNRIARALRMEEGEVTTELVVLENGGFVVREARCYRAEGTPEEIKIWKKENGVK